MVPRAWSAGRTRAARCTRDTGSLPHGPVAYPRAGGLRGKERMKPYYEAAYITPHTYPIYSLSFPFPPLNHLMLIDTRILLDVAGPIR